ncbi:MAG: HIT family protein [Myxococcota bacterium]
MCAILAGDAGPLRVVEEGRAVRAVLSRYPRTWGQVLIILRRHVTTFNDVSAEEWGEACHLARELAQRIETRLSPLRCYVSCLGTHRTDVPMSSPHLHLHIDPIYDPEDRPRTILTHKHGVLEAHEEEWDSLKALLKIR